MMIATLMLLAAAGGDIDWHVRVALAISPEGRATDCRVVDSDAPAGLQAKTCALLRDKARFTPGHDAAGAPVAGRFEGTIRYRIPAGGDPAAAVPAS